ncbi:hypothetical protein SBA3_1600007 [Candidatus Sulfopaludibacter sp. SbA3]|nr:hypothetical protein SBA3_1600007 [Candidatus Sulfopaludibacter sp. SbA3]
MVRLCNLPRLNPNATRLLIVSSESDTALEEFEAIFNSDPSLAAEVLRLANSAEFGLRAKVTNIKFALMLLGVERTRGLAFSIALSRYPRKGRSKADTRPFWLHSIATAVIAEEMGRALRAHIPLAYTAGLTHDLGRLGLLLTEGDPYMDCLKKEYRSVAESEQFERLRFGFTHSEAGAYLAQTWHFPPVLCHCIRTHHEVVRPEEEELARITQAACIMACELGFPELPDCPVAVEVASPAAALQRHLSMPPEVLRASIDQRMTMF